MLIVFIRLCHSAVAAAVAGRQAVAQDQVVVSRHAAAVNQEVPNPEADPKEVPTRAARRVHVVHLDAAKFEFDPSPLHPDSL